MPAILERYCLPVTSHLPLAGRSSVVRMLSCKRSRSSISLAAVKVHDTCFPCWLVACQPGRPGSQLGLIESTKGALTN